MVAALSIALLVTLLRSVRDRISGISMAGVFLGVMGEGFNMTVWGGLVRQDTRVIYLGMATVSLLINISGLVYTTLKE